MANHTITLTNTTSTTSTVAAVDPSGFGPFLLSLFLPLALFALLGCALYAFFVLMQGRRGRRASSLLGGGLLPLFGVLILIVAVLSFVLGLAAGSYLFSGFALTLPGGASLVFQPWQVSAFFAFIGIILIYLNAHRRKGRK